MADFIDWDSIIVRGSEKGVKKTTCPLCSESRKKKKDPCLYVNFESGVAKCYNCDALSFKDSNTDFVKSTYKAPPQQWQNYTKLSDQMVNWIRDTRGIRQETLIHFGITEEKQYQPAKQKELNNIVFNYFEGDKLVNKKYRSGAKDFTQTTGAKRIFYNINSVIGANKCWIVEGEFDVLAMYEAGVKEVISLPNGANDNDEFWKNSEKYLKDIEHFVIAVDNDEKGNIVKDKIAQRLGRYRCSYIEWQFKDANGDLTEGVIHESIKQIKRFPVGGTFKVEDLLEGVYDLHDNGLPETIYPKHESFGNVKDVFSIMRGQVTVITGIPSHGKSSFSEWHVLNLINDYTMKASFFSPEHSPMALHQTNFIQKAIGKPFWKSHDGIDRITKEDIERYKEWANEKLYLTGAEKGKPADWDWLLEKFKEQMYSFGIDLFVIDAFNKVMLDKGINKKDAIDDVMTRVTSFAIENNVHIFLVAHPTKMRKNDDGKYEAPTLYDVSGSADFRNQTHNGYCIYRYFANDNEDGFTTFINLKTKFSFQGEIGSSISYDYHLPTGRYYLKGTMPPLFDMTEHSKQKEPVQSALIPNDDFETPVEDCPF
jgi:twinkle protein